MRKVEGTVSSGLNGLPVLHAQVSVLKADSTPAQLYSDNGVTPLDQPVLTNGLGYWSFYVADGTYTRIVANPDGSNPITFPDEEMYEDARNVSVPVGEAAVSLPPIGARMARALGFDANGDPIAFDNNAVSSEVATAAAIAAAASEVNAASSAATADADADRAEIAADAAALSAGIYANEATGRAAVANGVIFSVVGATSDKAIDIWQRVNSGSSTLLRSYPSLDALNAAIQAIEALNGPAFASARCPPENGEDPTSVADSGGMYLPNTNNLFKVTTAGDTPFFATASAFAVMCSVPTKFTDVINRVDLLIAGTDRGSANLRSFRISYVAGGDPNNVANQTKFSVWLKGESAGGGVQAYSAATPAGFSGNAIVIVRNDGAGNVHVDFIDLQTQVMTTGPSTALPGAWAGIVNLTNAIGLGVNEDGTFPQSSPFGAQLNSYWKGEFANFMMVDGSTTDAQWQNIAAGADITSTIGAGNFRLWAKCASNGLLDTTVTSNKAAVTNGFTVRGTLHAGSTLCRQTTAAYLTIDRLGDPAFVSVFYGAQSGSCTITGKFAGVTGRLQYRIYQASKPVTGWLYLCDVPGSGSTWSAVAEFPLATTGEPYQFGVRATSAGSPVAWFNTELWVGYAISLTGQSQLWYTLSNSVTTAGIGPTPLDKRFDAGAAQGAFITRRVDVSGAGAYRFGTYRLNQRPAWAGDGLITQINYIRARTKVPLMFIEHAIVGTSCLDLMDDSLTSRQWVDYKTAAQTALANRDRAGRMILTGLVFYWATSDPSPAYGAQIWRPFIFGMQSVTQSGYYIAQSHITHFLMDGVDFNPSIKLVCAPYGREATATTPQTTDRGTQADIRDSQRADMASYGFISAPETTVFKFESSLIYGAHPDPANSNGVPTVAQAMAEGVCMAIGVGIYKGRATMASAAFTDGTRVAIRVTFTGPVGGRLAPFVVGTTDIRGHEVQDGGTGAWTKATHTAVIETPQTVVLTKTSGAWGVGTKVSYHSGSPGGYGEDDTAWRAGSLTWDGWPVAGSNTPVTAV